MQKKLHLLFALMLFVASQAMAQITTSGLSGKITDGQEELIGARIEAVHQPSGTRYVAVTNAKGQYTINGMRVGGPYEIKVSYIGFESKSVKGITLRLGETFRQNFNLKETSQEMQDLVVTGNKSKFAGEKTGAVTNISSEQMTYMPTVGRSITEFTRLSPYGGNGMTFMGQDGRTANFTVDGGNFNNDFGLSDGLPGGGNPISIEAIEEMQVVIAPMDVRQSGFIGGGINAITRSGTNTFKGSAYVYHQNENMRGDAIDGEQITTARQKDRKTTYGFTLGGPILKDKLFFFVNGEFAKSPNQAITWRASQDGVGNETAGLAYTTVEDMQKVQEYAKSKYGYNTGSYTDFPADEKNSKLLARIDWNINDKNHLALRYNYTSNTNWIGPSTTSMDGGVRSAFARTSLYSMAFANSMYSMDNLIHGVSLDLNSRISNDLNNQLLVTFTKKDDVRGSNSDEFPFIDIQDGTNTNTQYMSLGYELFTWNNAVHTTNATVKDELTWYMGNHKLIGGLTYEYQMDDNQYMRNGTGYYRYRSVDDFVNGATPEVVCLTYGYGGEKSPAARVRYNKAGLYLQDEWTASDRFTLNYGIRLETLMFNNKDIMTNNAILDLDYNGRHIDTGKWPSTQLIAQPRVGFNWDVLGNKSLKVRGGTGLFSGRLPMVFFTNMPTNGGMVQYQAQIGPSIKDANLPQSVQEKGYTTVSSILQQFNAANNGGYGLAVDANGKATIDALQQKLIGMGFPSDITPEKGAAPGSISAVDPKFKMPMIWKNSLAVEYTVPVSFPLTITAEGTFNKDVHKATISDWSMMDVEGFTRWNGADARPIYPSNFRTTNKAFVLENSSKGYNYSLSINVNASPSKYIDLFAAYTHMGAKELTSLPGSNAESAFTYVPTVNGPNNIKLHNAINLEPDRFIASINGHDKSNNHYSLIYETWRGGYNYSYMMANDMNGDGYNYDALYIPTDKQVENGEFRFVSSDDQQRFMDYVHNNSYLKSHQGEYAEAYSVYSPWVHRVDVSYKHDFKVKAGKQMNTLQLGFDIKNLMNLFCNSWGVSKYMNAKLNSGRILKYEKTDADGHPVFSTPKAVDGKIQTFGLNHGIGQCWYMSVGVKYMFN